MDNRHDPSHEVFQPQRTAGGGWVPPKRMRGLTDVDLDSDGAIHSRPGHVLAVPMTDPQGAWSVAGRLLYQDGNTLYADGSALVSGLLRRINAPCAHGGRIYLSDGVHHFEWDGSTVRTWGLPVPTMAVLPTRGNLPPGNYLARVTFVDARGNEGGASDLLPVEIGIGGGALLFVSGITEAVASINLYTGDIDQDHVSFALQFPATQPVLDFSLPLTAADPPVTAQMQGPLLGHVGAVSFRAFLLLWREHVIFRSEGQEPHLYDAENIMQFDAPVRACEALTEGLWVGTDAGLWWVSGDGPESWIPRRRSTAAVLPGSRIIPGTKLPAAQSGDLVALFATTDGPVAATNGGVVPLSDDRHHFASGRRASLCYAERAQYRQILIGLSRETSYG
jgi:hypothetical protein